MERNTIVAVRVRNCLQTKFYGVYLLLKLKILKIYGLKLDDILAEDIQKARNIVKELVDSGQIPRIVLKECLCLESESEEKLPVIESVYPKHSELLLESLSGLFKTPSHHL